MATGVNNDKMNAFKIELLNYTESINYLKERLDNCKILISNNIEGECKLEILSKIDSILNQMPVVNNNINNYISTIDKVSNIYVEQDYLMNSQLSKNIEKIDRLKEEM